MSNKDYIKLFVKREGKVVFGKRCSNMWLLSAVLILTFSAVAFSNASLKYLSYKMEDPFINWLDIEYTSADADYYGLQDALNDSTTRAKYNIIDYEEDVKYSLKYFTKDYNQKYLTGRYFESLNTDLVNAVLANDNVVSGQKISSLEVLAEGSLGVILTQESLNNLGYSKAPAFIYYAQHSPGADEIGFQLFRENVARDEYDTGIEAAMVPIPVLGVVHKLPGNVDYIASTFFLDQYYSYPNPFYMNNVDYASSLHFFVPSSLNLDSFSREVIEIAQNKGVDIAEDRYSFYLPQFTPYIDGDFVSFYGEYGIDPLRIQEIAYKVIDKYGSRNVTRVYNYEFYGEPIGDKSYMSVHFRNLDKINEFDEYVKSEFKINLEMAQINAKKNFNAISILANILSWAIVAFSILCIILFVVNLLQSYFQKVKRNLGTFKAFGISNAELISVFVVIMIVLAAASIVISLTVVYLAQIVLPMLGFVKEGGFGYLYLWNDMTMGTIAIVVISSVVTVYLVMRKLLSATPGDLIYDR